MKKERLNIRLLYLALHNQLTKKHGINNTLTRKEFYIKLGKHYMIPKSLRYVVIKEMEEMNLIKQVDRDNIEVLPHKINIERDAKDLFNLANLY
jgi:hypothetical protein